VKNDFEIGEITRLIKPTAQSRVLDIGSGNGHHVKLLEKAGYNVEGIDKSSAMVEGAKNKYPKCKFKQADALESMTYPQNTFTTITCLYFTIYYISDKQLFLQNCYNWLKPGGTLVLHLVNRDKFDPILNAADPLHLVSAQKYAKKRITNSLVKFKDFQYKANFELDKSKNLAEFDETFKDDKSGHVRQNKHKLFIETQKHILSIAKNLGFILHGKVDMVTSQYQYQYIYLLYKPQ
jgi:SAM-dependent methyltransferase